MEKLPDVSSGRVVVDENGVPTGIFRGEAKEAVYSRLPKLGVERIKQSLVAACEK